MTDSVFKLNRKALFGMMVLAAAGAMPAYAAEITVDPAATDAALAGDGKCSLREAVLSINAGQDVGDCEAVITQAYGINDTIRIPAGIYTLTIPGSTSEDYYQTGVGDLAYVLVTDPDATIGDLDLTKSVTIVGDGMGQTIIDGGALDRVFQIVADPVTATTTINVSISNLTVKDGKVDLVPIDIVDPDGTVPYWLFKKLGGGIATGVAAAVVQYTPTETGPGSDRGQSQVGGPPGGEEETGATYSLTLNNVAVVSNVSGADGGGIYNVAALTADGVLIDSNTAGANGGGLYNEGKTIIRGSKIGKNTAEGGGGIFMTGSAQTPVYIMKSSIMDNTAIGGGGISARTGPALYVTNSTISGNTGNDVGGGIYTNGTASLVNSTVVDNRAAPEATDNAPGGAGLNTFGSGSFTLWNTLLANNTKLVDSSEVANCGQSGGGLVTTIISKGHNLESLASTCANLTGTSPGLTTATGDLFGLTADGKLAARDEATGVYALNADSSAINVGDSAATFQDGSGSEVAVSDDQLGTLRPAGQFDIGAYELASANTTPSSDDGGGCATGGNGRFDPVMPAMLAAALAFFGWRRFKAGK